LTGDIEKLTDRADAFDGLADEIRGLTIPKQSWELIWASVTDKIVRDARRLREEVDGMVEHRAVLLLAEERAITYEKPAIESREPLS
jgi:hypothetical protein